MGVKHLDNIFEIPRGENSKEAEEAEILSDDAELPEIIDENAEPEPVAAVDVQGYEEEINEDDVYIDQKLKGLVNKLENFTDTLTEAMEETMERTGLLVDSKDIQAYTSLINTTVNAVSKISNVNENRKKRLQKEISERRRAVTGARGISFKTDDKGNVDNTDGTGRKLVSRSELIAAGKKNITRGKNLLKE